MTIYGYARVSTDGQSLASQDAQLHAAGCAKVYSEKITLLWHRGHSAGFCKLPFGRRELAGMIVQSESLRLPLGDWPRCSMRGFFWCAVLLGIAPSDLADERARLRLVW